MIVSMRKLVEQTSCRPKIDIGNQCLTHLFALTSNAKPTRIDGMDKTYITTWRVSSAFVTLGTYSFVAHSCVMLVYVSVEKAP